MHFVCRGRAGSTALRPLCQSVGRHTGRRDRERHGDGRVAPRVLPFAAEFREDALERLRDRFEFGSPLAIALEELPDERANLAWSFAALERSRRCVQPLGRDLLAALPRERALPRREEVDQDPQGVRIRSAVHGIAEDLFRRRVLRRTDETGGLERDVDVALGALEQFRDAEVEHVDALVGATRVLHEDIAGLQVAVHDAPAVGVVEDLGELLDDARQPHRRERTVLLDDASQWSAVHVLHREVERAVGCAPVVDDLRDRRVLKRAKDFDLTIEARCEFRGRRVFRQNRLQRDLASIAQGVADELDLTETAASDRLEDAIASVEQGGVLAWKGGLVRHGDQNEYVKPIRVRNSFKSSPTGPMSRLVNVRRGSTKKLTWGVSQDFMPPWMP